MGRFRRLLFISLPPGGKVPPKGADEGEMIESFPLLRGGFAAPATTYFAVAAK